MPEPRPPVSFSLAATSLFRREIVRFLRQRGRLIGAFLTPVMFWFFIGSGLGKSFRAPGATESMNFLEYAYPGTILMIVLFTAIFSAISVIQDRNEGFLQGVLVAPVPRSAIVAGKVFGASVMALLQAGVFLLLAPTLGITLSALQVLESLAAIFLIALGLSSLGFCFAWRTDSIQGFHAIMNVVLFPLWLVSGALFPASGASGWLSWVMHANPLTYGLAVLRRAMYGEAVATQGAELPDSTVCWLVTIAFLVVTYVLAVRQTAKQVDPT
ncbi:MAG: ABC transporter permease [Planctomycetes bacterium]|nr:ABC transporter permease [Planctomycetota bacterium]